MLQKDEFSGPAYTAVTTGTYWESVKIINNRIIFFEDQCGVILQIPTPPQFDYVGGIVVGSAFAVGFSKTTEKLRTDLLR